MLTPVNKQLIKKPLDLINTTGWFYPYVIVEELLSARKTPLPLKFELLLLLRRELRRELKDAKSN